MVPRCVWTSWRKTTRKCAPFGGRISPLFSRTRYHIEEMLCEHKKSLTSAEYKKEAIEDLADMGIPAPEIRNINLPASADGNAAASAG